ncbi:MAG: hypothetical protein ABI675_05600 [Chitinophagaceae bacterium]
MENIASTQYVDRTYFSKQQKVTEKLQELIKVKDELAAMGIIVAESLTVDKEGEEAYYSDLS